VETLKRIIISRTDNLGDVVLTLPMTGFLKKIFPQTEIIFLGNSYTKPLLETCEHIDKIVEWDKIRVLSFRRQRRLFKQWQADVIIHVFPDKRIALLGAWSKIKIRIGTSHRWYHFLYANRRINLGRKKSLLHESELNMRLLIPLLINNDLPAKEDLPAYYGLNRVLPLPERLLPIIEPHKFNVILHPKSKGSAREWGLDKYAELVRLLPIDKFNIIVAGTDFEAEQMEYFLRVYAGKIKDVTGELTLSEYISLIHNADGMVACSTGPLHIAAALGKHALGIYAPLRPIFPQRWGPVGTNAIFFVDDKECYLCRKNNHCECIEHISAQQVADELFKRAMNIHHCKHNV